MKQIIENSMEENTSHRNENGTLGNVIFQSFKILNVDKE